MSWVTAAVVVALVVFALDRLATRLIRPNLQPIHRAVPEMGLPYEDLLIETGEVPLHGWLLGPGDGGGRGPVVVLAHGWGANHSVVARLGEPLADRGRTVVLFDARGHGRNPERRVVTIKDFRDDVAAVTRYVRERFPRREVAVVGHSMGGAASVLAAAEGTDMEGLVLIAAPSDVLRVTAEYLSDEGLPGDLLVTILRPFFWRRVGGTFRSLTPSRRIGELTLPILIIQPELDARVVRSHADRLSAAAGLDYRLVDDREHTDVLSDAETLRLVEEFLDRVST